MYEEDKNSLGREKGAMKGECREVELILMAASCPRWHSSPCLALPSSPSPPSPSFFLPSRLNEEKETPDIG